ncbi:hypothetical protein HAX54_042737 [Datura stramonium]|uniref:Uncharacterized protein n=1 Tax=Datura stramonium TaxID=4076 RepID=A0ABS8W2X6_DATST|nr:hypothetical protein [Datura stramonium]
MVFSRLIPSWNTSKVPIEFSILLACIMDHVHINVDRTVQANSVITLATKTDKEASVMKRAKYTRSLTPPTPSTSTHTAAAPPYKANFHNSPPLDLLNISRRAKMHESQLLQLANAIPSMVQSALKKALQPAKDKLIDLCSIVDVLERKVCTNCTSIH